MKQLLFLLFVLPTMTTSHSYDFGTSCEKCNDWFVVLDGVMGGLSTGELAVTENSFVISGEVSLENNGGFASVRAIPQNFDQKEFKKIKLRVKGDGKIYQFRMRSTRNFDGIAYTLDFETEKDKWKEIELAVDDFRPTFRGRVYPQYGKFNSSELQQIGILIANKQVGEFHLELDWVRVEQ